jgi:hypothetical protein
MDFRAKNGAEIDSKQQKSSNLCAMMMDNGSAMGEGLTENRKRSAIAFSLLDQAKLELSTHMGIRIVPVREKPVDWLVPAAPCEQEIAVRAPNGRHKYGEPK